MSSIQEQLTAAAKAHFESQFQLLNTLTSKAFEGVERVIELNLDAARTSLDDASSAAREIGTAKDPQSLISASAATVRPGAEKTLDYNRRLAEIGESIYAEVIGLAETQVTESRARLTALIEEAEKNAPAGSENAIALMKSVLANADAGYEQVVQSARKAVDTLHANAAAAGKFVQAAGESTKAAPK